MSQVTVTETVANVTVTTTENLVVLQNQSSTNILNVVSAGPQGPPGPGGQYGWYGSFVDTTTQHLLNVAIAQPVAIQTALEANGVSLQDGSKIVFANGATYSITISIQFTNEDNQIRTADLWLRKNGVDVPDTNSRVDVPGTKAGVDGHLLATVNFVLTLAPADYLQIYFSAESTNISVETLPAATNPVRPQVPAIIFTAQQITHTQTGPAGPAGAAGPAGPTGPAGPAGEASLGGYGVVISSISNEDLIQFNGTNWVNRQPSLITDGGNF